MDKRVDYGVFEILVLEFLTKDESLNEEVDLFSIASGISHILRTKYTVSVQLLDV